MKKQLLKMYQVKRNVIENARIILKIKIKLKIKEIPLKSRIPIPGVMEIYVPKSTFIRQFKRGNNLKQTRLQLGKYLWKWFYLTKE